MCESVVDTHMRIARRLSKKEYVQSLKEFTFYTRVSLENSLTRRKFNLIGIEFSYEQKDTIVNEIYILYTNLVKTSVYGLQLFRVSTRILIQCEKRLFGECILRTWQT